MPRINLLPWREELRKQRNKEFTITCIVVALMALAAIGGVHYSFNQQINFQNNRNQFLETEIAQLDKKIKEIKELDAEKEALIARMQIIQQLQSSRPEIVHLFDEFVTTLPEGIFYNKVVQKGREITLTGVAQSNARVSSLMRNFEASLWLEQPSLVEIRRETKQSSEQEILRLSNFSVSVKQILQKQEDEI
tara:strand:- start:109 stop:684 length:576 start_codon:yes stop_codon:yes gene_type:complete